MKTILLIEDDTVLANMYSQKFTMDGYDILVATDGKEGLELAKENKVIDLVITDIMLPRVSGIDFINNFRKIKNKKNVPIIAWSNLSEESEKEKALKAGAEEYLIKANVSLNDIVTLVKKYIGD